MYNFPLDNDSLFVKSNNFTDIEIETGINRFFFFSESYRKSSEAIFEKVSKLKFESRFLVIPVIFLCRHYLELRLKELISGINYTKTENYSFPDGHNLEFLWNSYKTALTDADYSIQPSNIDLNNIERLILEFNNIDSNSMSFRYPVEKDKTTETLQNLQAFDIENFIQIMTRIYNFFYEQSGNLFHLIAQAEEYFSFLHRQMILEYYH